jgi:hypothetical protein
MPGMKKGDFIMNDINGILLGMIILAMSGILRNFQKRNVLANIFDVAVLVGTLVMLVRRLFFGVLLFFVLIAPTSQAWASSWLNPQVEGSLFPKFWAADRDDENGIIVQGITQTLAVSNRFRLVKMDDGSEIYFVPRFSWERLHGKADLYLFKENEIICDLPFNSITYGYGAEIIVGGYPWGRLWTAAGPGFELLTDGRRKIYWSLQVQFRIIRGFRIGIREDLLKNGGRAGILMGW